MKNWISTTMSIFAFLLLANTNLQAQFDFEFCGSTFTVNCDGTVNVDLAENVWIYKVWDGDELIAELNNFRDDVPDVFYFPFVGGVDFGNPVGPGQNVYLDVQTEDCGQFILNISQVIAQNCPQTGPSFEFCGSTFHVNCDGTVNVDLAENVWIYKVWDGPNLIAELNNFDASLPDVFYFPFLAGVDFGNPVSPGQNVYLDVQTEDCGQFILNISDVLREFCGFLQADLDEFDDLNTDRNTTGVDELTAYPNPAGSQITIGLPEIEGNYQVRMTDLNGRMLRQLSISGGNQQLDTSTLPQGIYILTAQNGDQVYTKRIQKS